MKYLQDDRLSALTSRFDYDLSGGLRHVQGRIEAYTMKRAGNDKKYAADLGIKYVSFRDSMENQLATTSISSSSSAEDPFLAGQAVVRSSLPPLPTSRNRRAYSVGAQFDDAAMPEQKKARTRSNSLDITTTTSNSTFLYRQTSLGDFADMATRRLMTDLILTLNMSFPDYDFDCVSPNDFEKCELPSVVRHVQSLLGDTAAGITGSQLSKESSRRDLSLESIAEGLAEGTAPSAADNKSFITELWSALDNVIQLSDCEVYLWKNHPEDLNQNQEGELVVWSFYYLFVNKTLKRIVFFSCCETLLNHTQSYDGETEIDLVSEEDEEDESNHLYTDASECDFDLDPSAVHSGGIPISTV